MPSADTLVKPPGSMRRTRAGSIQLPPQPLTTTVAPGWTLMASVDSNSTTISISAASPISTSGVPEGITFSLS